MRVFLSMRCYLLQASRPSYDGQGRGATKVHRGASFASLWQLGTTITECCNALADQRGLHYPARVLPAQATREHSRPAPTTSSEASASSHEHRGDDAQSSSTQSRHESDAHSTCVSLSVLRGAIGDGVCVCVQTIQHGYGVHDPAVVAEEHDAQQAAQGPGVAAGAGRGCEWRWAHLLFFTLTLGSA